MMIRLTIPSTKGSDAARITSCDESYIDNSLAIAATV